MTFRVGQKVVCVSTDAFNSNEGAVGSWLRVDAVYTVSALGAHPRYPDLPCVYLCEVNRTAPFAASRFRPVVERKTDISIFTEILRKASKPARGPAVTSPQRA
jgi:hypothetical protein